jgi:Zn-dependent metalloprotease
MFWGDDNRVWYRRGGLKMFPKLRAALIVFVSGAFLFMFTLPAWVQQGVPEKITSKAAAQKPKAQKQPSPELIRRWQEFAARTKARSVFWNPKTGTHEGMFGELSQASGKRPAAAAREFLRANHALFSMRYDISDLNDAASFDTPMGSHAEFQQVFEGVPVFGARTTLQFDRGGVVVAVANTYVPNVFVPSVQPAISKQEAINAAERAVGSSAEPKSAADLVISAEDETPTLTWRVTVATLGPTWELFVDAQSGAPIGEPRDINQYVNGTGQIFNVNAVVATRDNTLRDLNDSAAAVPSSAYSIVTLANLQGDGNLDGAYASSSRTKKRVFNSSNSFIFDRTSDGFSEVMGYYYIDIAERYIQSLGFANINNRQQVFSVNRLNRDNSFYSPSTTEITYGLGGVDDAEDAEVILHEYGHSIQDNQVPGFGSSLEAGSMGEGFGDYWGASIGAQTSGGFQDLCIADWDATSYSSANPPCLRRLDSPKHYPEDVVGEVHDDGEMWSAALWQIRGSIGAAKADRVILQAHFLLSPSASFNQGANALVTAAINLGYKKPEVNSMRTILQNRGFTV